MADLTVTDDQAFDAATSGAPVSRSAWMAEWAERLQQSWKDTPAMLRSVIDRLLPPAPRAAEASDEIATRLDVLESRVTDGLAHAETRWRRQLDAVRATTAALERRVAALEAQGRDGDSVEDDADVPRVSARSSDAMRDVLARAGELAAQRGLTTTTEAAIVFGDQGGKTAAKADGPVPRPRKPARSRRRRA